MNLHVPTYLCASIGPITIELGLPDPRLDESDSIVLKPSSTAFEPVDLDETETKIMNELINN